MEHCKNNVADREIGAFWERQFCLLSADVGKSFTPMQIGRDNSAMAFSKNGRWNKYTLPDVTVWTAPGEHHEIKHKNPTKNGMFGLEVYRFNALFWFARETQQDVMYTIHNHALAGGREIKENKIEHWITANILALNDNWVYTTNGNSWVNGQRKETQIHYWPISLWQPLVAYWGTNA